MWRRVPFLLLAALLLGTGLGIGLGLSEAPTSTDRSAVGAGAAPRRQITIRPQVLPTALPGGQKLPPGAYVSSVVHFQGQRVAAGLDIPAGGSAVLPACAGGCNPVVWTSRSGRSWIAAWGNNLGPGSIPASTLVVGAGRLLLFSGDEATRLWLSTDAVTWDQVALPETMAALDIEGAVFGHGRFVVILNNKYAGGPNSAYGQSDTAWTSKNGSTWTRIAVEGPPALFKSVTVTPRGFRITGILRDTGQSAVWSSSDGTRFSTTARGPVIDPPEG